MAELRSIRTALQVLTQRLQQLELQSEVVGTVVNSGSLDGGRAGRSKRPPDPLRGAGAVRRSPGEGSCWVVFDLETGGT